ncbi:MAG: type IV secretion system DNA-binding domain-containing protein [Actinobacteria bacterium]|nr:type IV secretion system DNA-binding domain-containing protein [Actinomycetota bacterium]
MTDLISQFFKFFLIFVLFLLTIGVVIPIIKSIIEALVFSSKLKKRLENEDKTFLLVKISPSNEQKEDRMDELLRSLHRVLPNSTEISLEIASVDQFLSFYIVVPKNQKNILESQLYAQYPDAEVEEKKDYLPEFDYNTAFAQLNFKNPSIYPVSTYKSLNEDLLKNFSAMLAKTERGEKVFLQIAFKRIGSKFWERGWQAFYYKVFGKKYNRENMNIAQIKLSHDLYLGKLRFAYMAKDKVTASAKLNTLMSLLKILKGENNEFKNAGFLFNPKLDQLFKARIFKKGDLWTSTEIATIYHFPYKGVFVSNVVNTTSKRAPAPDILPREGVVNPREVTLFGETNYRNEGKKFGIKRIDRRRHLYVIGKTGSGKSRLLELLLISDIQSGQGCCLLDPHGDLADELLMYVPKERIKDVVYVNPADRDFPIGFNPLESVSDYETRQHLSTFFIAIFKKLFSFNWNPRMEHIIRYVTLALLETKDSNVLGISRILSDTSFRQRVIKGIQDPVVKSFWTNEFSTWNERFANDAVIPILNKVGQFIANPIIRNMVGQRKNVLDFEKFMNEGKIVIINISKGKLGEDNVALLGSMFITKIQQAALSRAKFPEHERRDFYFYVDEFQNFATDAFSTILSEARKYHLDLTIAHQYIAQLPEDVKATAFGNVGSIITFAVGGDDAAYLTREFAPIFSADDMINLNVREMYIKMSIDGKLTSPFSARTIDIPKPSFDYSIEIVDHSRMKYGNNRVVVENEIERWSQSTESLEVSSGKNEEFPEPII